MTIKHLTTCEVAHRLNITPRGARRLMERRGVKPVATVGRSVLWSEADVRKIESNRDRRYHDPREATKAWRRRKNSP